METNSVCFVFCAVQNLHELRPFEHEFTWLCFEDYFKTYEINYDDARNGGQKAEIVLSQENIMDLVKFAKLLNNLKSIMDIPDDYLISMQST